MEHCRFSEGIYHLPSQNKTKQNKRKQSKAKQNKTIAATKSENHNKLGRGQFEVTYAIPQNIISCCEEKVGYVKRLSPRTERDDIESISVVQSIARLKSGNAPGHWLLIPPKPGK